MKGTTMKSGCFKREQLMAYSTRLLEAPEEAVIRRHLGECAACRAVANQYGAVDSMLEEWKPAEPSPWFDARLRAAVAAAGAKKARRGLFGLAWRRWAAPVVAAALVVAVSVVALRVRKPGHSGITTRVDSRVSGVASGAASQTTPPGSSMAGAGEGPGEAQAGVQPGTAVTGQTAAEADGSGPGSSYAAQVTEDDDMLANFDVLSELPATPEGAGSSN